MKIRVENIVTYILVLAVGGWFIISYISNQNSLKQERKSELEKKRVQEQSIAELISKYGAVKYKKISRRDFTINKQEALLDTNGKPVYFKAYLRDIFKVDGEYMAQLYSAEPNMLIELKCTIEQVNKMRSTSESGESEWLFNRLDVIAQIDTVQKPKYKISAARDGEDAYVEVDSESDVIAIGRCIDFMGQLRH